MNTAAISRMISGSSTDSISSVVRTWRLRSVSATSTWTASSEPVGVIVTLTTRTGFGPTLPS